MTAPTPANSNESKPVAEGPRTSISRTSGPSASRIIGADAVRAVACLWVLAAHLMMDLPASAQVDSVPWITVYRGSLGVAMFFVLSGFLLSAPYWHTLATDKLIPSLRKFAWRRLARIVPGFWFCAIATYLLRMPEMSPWELGSVALTLGFVNSFVASSYEPWFNPPLWSISIEMGFYVLLPITMWLAFRGGSFKRAIVTLVLSMAALAIGQRLFLAWAPTIESQIAEPAIFKADAWSSQQHVLVLYAHFLLGVIAAAVHGHLKSKRSVSAAQGPVLLDAACLLIIVALLFGTPYLNDFLPTLEWMRYGWPSFPTLIAALLVMLPFTRWIGPTCDNAFVRLTATLSFGIYMWHVPVLHWMHGVWAIDATSSLGTCAGYAICAVACTYLIAWASYRWIEKPFIDLAHRRTTNSAS